MIKKIYINPAMQDPKYHIARETKTYNNIIDVGKNISSTNERSKMT
jgi:hypothetical protein